MDMQSQSFKDARILITGGLGFIGSNLAIQLVNAGARITIIDNLYEHGGANPFNIQPIRNRLKLITEDLEKSEQLDAIVAESDYVFDLAAQVSHVESMRDPMSDLRMNCTAHLRILEACRKSSSDARMLYTGSRVQYGRITKTPVREDHPIAPVDNNGISKHACESYYLLYNRTYGLRCTSLRLTNTYGPRNVMKHARQGFVNWFVKLCVDRQPIEIFGSGEQLREFTYVDDAVSACLLAVGSSATVGRAFNVGGVSASVRKVADTLSELRPGTNITNRPFPEERKSIEIGDYLSDYSEFHNATGWMPKTSLEDGLERTLKYYEEFKSKYW